MSERLAALKHLMDMRSQQMMYFHHVTLPELRVFLACLFIPFIAWWQMEMQS